jgi:iron complex outermembrane recepter protein
MATRTHLRREDDGLTKLSRLPLRAAIAAVLVTAAALPATSVAQEQLGEVVVSGIRVGIQNAIEAKRESTSIIEAISAEDIGKLPDTSIAESISRLPGITSQRA